MRKFVLVNGKWLAIAEQSNGLWKLEFHLPASREQLQNTYPNLFIQPHLTRAQVRKMQCAC